MEALRLPQEKIVLEVLENLQAQIWSWIDKSIKGFLKRMIEDLLEGELDNYLEATRYERTSRRKGYRNGHYQRRLATRYGLIEDLQIPRTQGKGPDFKVFDRYQRRRHDVEAALGQLFLQGVSTRRLRGIARELFGQEVSPTTISKAASYLDKELRHYQEKPLLDDIEFLFLDGITQKVRELGVECKTILCAFGIHQDGRKELLSFRLADTEDMESWRGFMVDLKTRGLVGKNLKLITADGNPALLKALRDIYPFKPVQRCIAHKLRNVAVKLRRIHQRACLTEARGIFTAQSKKEAIRSFKAWKAQWLPEAERAVKCLEKDLYHCLHYYQFPKEQWKTLRTTNILERAFREVRRRTRPMGVFSNAQSANRIMYGVTDLMNKNWRKNPLQLISTKSLT